jgi:hypothetical protein
MAQHVEPQERNIAKIALANGLQAASQDAQ